MTTVSPKLVYVPVAIMTITLVTRKTTVTPTNSPYLSCPAVPPLPPSIHLTAAPPDAD